MDPAANFAVSTVATAPSPATTGGSLVLATGQGARFPDPSTDGAFSVVATPNGTAADLYFTNAEILRVYARSSDTLYFTRQAEGTTARSILAGWVIEQNVTAKVITDITGWLTQVVAITDVTALRTWHDALANRYAAPAKVVVIGDSYEEGQGASTWARTWPQRFLARLREMYPTTGVTGADGFLSAGSTLVSPSYTYPVTLSGGATNAGSTVSFGLKLTTLSAAGHTVSYTFTGTKVDIWFAQSAAATVDIKIDGTTVVGSSYSTAGSDPNFVWTSGTLTNASHTVAVSRVTGTSYVIGFQGYNGDDVAGIQLANCSRYGIQATQISAASQTWRGGISKINPDLVVIKLGGNDQTAGRSPAQLKADLQAIISGVRGQVGLLQPSIAILRKGSFDDGNNTYRWSQYMTDTYDAMMAEDPSLFLVDYTDQMWPQTIGNNRGLYYSDLDHPSDMGHSRIAEMVASTVQMGPSIAASTPKFEIVSSYAAVPAGTTAVTSTFRCPSSAVLILAIGLNATSATGNNVTTVTDTLGLTWVFQGRKSRDSGSVGGAGGDGAVEFWAANVDATHGGTDAVTITQTTSGKAIIAEVVAVLGSSISKIRGLTAAGTNDSNYPTMSFTPTALGSIVFAKMEDWNVVANPMPTACSQVLQSAKTTPGITSVLTATVTAKPSQVNTAFGVGELGPTGQNWNLLALELLP